MNSSEKLGQAWQHHQAGQFHRAEHLYQQVLSSEPEHPDALHMLGILAHQTGHSEPGIELVKRALRNRPDDARIHANLAMMLEASGRLERAIEHNRKALALMPEHTGAWLNLANQLRATGEIDEAIASYRALLSQNPDDVAGWSNLGSALRSNGELDQAIEAFERALTLSPDSADVHSNLGNALQEADRHDDAIKAFRKAIALRPDFADAHANLGIAHLQTGRTDEAISALDACLQLEPANRTALAMKTIALCEADNAEAAQALTDLDVGIRETVVDSARGFESSASFNRALAEHACNHPSIRYEPFSKTTRRGRQTGNLLEGTRGPVARLEQIINDAVRAYLDDMPFPPDHPYRGRQVKNWSLNVWATVLDDQGHQAPHIHPGGWLSGVYYVSLPKGMHDNDNAGAIEFGCVPDGFTLATPPRTRLLTPKEGSLLVFPSFFYHRTLPFKSGQPRISIAFDAIPVE
ncbi:MAG: tetratricopeptide repeat protein [Gammaproteobacteria bacterium]|nr:tetratricopeptide repeat protein [Gammaproteobacteria bacterium]